MSIKIMGSPSRYIQGNGEIKNLHKYVTNYGKRIFIIADQFVTSLLSEKIEASFKDTDTELHFEEFNGEVTNEEIERLLEIFSQKQCDVVIGIGGGKTIDTAKVVAYKAGVATVIIPTIASNNAASSALSVIYNIKGEFESVFILPKNPDLVFVDVAVIAQAPTRLLVAGMGDAFAAYYEARACKASNADNMHKGKATNAAFGLTEICNTILFDDGLKAKIAVDAKVVTKALENIVEANIYLSGVGFESNGLAIAHAVAKGFTTLVGEHEYLHGEWVAFGTLVQLVSENVSVKEIEKVLKFFHSVGLPMGLEDLGVGSITREELKRISEVIASVPSGHNMPYEYSDQDIFAAILTTDAIGKSYKKYREVL